MNTKSFFASKINWAAIALCLSAILPNIQNFSGTTVKDYVTFAIGAVIIVLRTYFTNTVIATPTKTNS